MEPTDTSALEATTNAWECYAQRTPLVASVTMAYPFLVKLVVAPRIKTDDDMSL